jgi:cyclopropane fatty-acyl-phospholipid synthase-like methyltransferase
VKSDGACTSNAAAAFFEALERVRARPRPFERSTTRALWTDPHVSKGMLAAHLDETVDAASRRPAFIDASVAWIATRFGLTAGHAVLDLGCGPGLYAARLAERGARVTGVDFSERSIAYARRAADERGLSIDYVLCDYLAFDTDARFDLVLMVMRDFGVLGPDQRRALLERVGALLTPGGRLLFDVDSLAAFAKREEGARYDLEAEGGFWASGRAYAFLTTFKYETERVVLDKHTIVERGRVRTVLDWHQHYSPESLAAELEDGGFEVEEVLGDVAGAPYDASTDEFAVVARRLSEP